MLVRRTDTAPVVVNVAVFGFGVPYSVGFLNCFSLTMLWLEVDTSTLLQNFPSIKLLPMISPSLLVEHASKIPRNGILKSLAI